jgi:hypothetical protein
LKYPVRDVQPQLEIILLGTEIDAGFGTVILKSKTKLLIFISLKQGSLNI